jgi:hypothetical protein
LPPVCPATFFLLNIVVSPGNGRKSHKMPQQQENVGLPASAQAKGKNMIFFCVTITKEKHLKHTRIIREFKKKKSYFNDDDVGGGRGSFSAHPELVLHSLSNNNKKVG